MKVFAFVLCAIIVTISGAANAKEANKVDPVRKLASSNDAYYCGFIDGIGEADQNGARVLSFTPDKEKRQRLPIFYITGNAQSGILGSLVVNAITLHKPVCLNMVRHKFDGTEIFEGEITGISFY
jgi:hypothetical protein